MVVSPPIARGRPGGSYPGRPSVDGTSPASRSRPSAPGRSRSGRRPGEACREARHAISQRVDAGQFAEAVPPAREKLDLLARTLGKDHWQTATPAANSRPVSASPACPVRSRIATRSRGKRTTVRVSSMPAASMPRPRSCSGRTSRSVETSWARTTTTPPPPTTTWPTLGAQGKYAEAEAIPPCLGDHAQGPGRGPPDTATKYDNLAGTLHAQGKYAEAEAMLRRDPGDPAQGPGRGPPQHRHQLR